jgi:hypothetical protein
MRYFVIFNLFCLAAFLQLASRAPLVDENEQPIERFRRNSKDILRGLFGSAAPEDVEPSRNSP